MAYQSMRYQYETSPRKLNPEYETGKKQNSKKKNTVLNKKQPKAKTKKYIKSHTKIVLYVVIGFAILFAISYRNSLITESFNTKEDLKKQLSSLQKENAQLEINIQSSLNLSNIEKSASSMLGMKKLDETQKIYVSLPKKDYIEPASEQVVVEEETNWFEKMLDSITDFIK